MSAHKATWSAEELAHNLPRDFGKISILGS